MVEETSVHGTLTERGRELLHAIENFSDVYGYPPTVRDLQGIVGLASPSTVYAHLEKLRWQGAVDWVTGSTRTLHVTPAGRRALVL